MHSINTRASGLWPDGGTCKDTAACTGPDFRQSHRGRVQAPEDTTRHILQRGHTATPGGWRATLCGGDGLSVRAANGVPLCLARAIARDVPPRVGGGVSHSLAAARLPSQSSSSPVLKTTLKKSQIVGLAILFLKPVIGPPLIQLSLSCLNCLLLIVQHFVYLGKGHFGSKLKIEKSRIYHTNACETSNRERDFSGLLKPSS